MKMALFYELTDVCIQLPSLGYVIADAPSFDCGANSNAKNISQCQECQFQD